MSTDFDRLIEEAVAQDFFGWNFSWLRGRWYEEGPPRVALGIRKADQGKIAGVRSLLDRSTGGGEFLASLAPHLARPLYAAS